MSPRLVRSAVAATAVALALGVAGPAFADDPAPVRARVPVGASSGDAETLCVGVADVVGPGGTTWACAPRPSRVVATLRPVLDLLP